MDRRATILRAELLKVGEPDIQTSVQAIYNAMDENGRKMCLELLEYMEKKNISLCYTMDGARWIYNKELLSKEQLIENFL